MKKWLILLCLLLLMAGAALAEEAPVPAALSACASVPVEEAAPVAVLAFELTAQGATATDAHSAMEAMRAELMEALSQHGVTEQDVQLTNYSMAGQYDYHHTKMTKKRLLTGYGVSARMEVRFADTAVASAAADEVFQHGLEFECALTFESSRSQQAEDAALTAAVQEAMRKAQLMAQACGVTLGDVTHVEESLQDGCAQVEVTYAVQ